MTKYEGNLGEYQRMTTEAKELGGVKSYKEKYIKIGREREKCNNEKEDSILWVEIISFVAIPIVIHGSKLALEKAKTIKKEDVIEAKEKLKRKVIKAGIYTKNKMFYFKKEL